MEIVWTFIGSSSTYTIQARGWMIITMKDNKTIEIVFLKNESLTNNDNFCFWFVSESQLQNMIILGRSLPPSLEIEWILIIHNNCTFPYYMDIISK